MDKRGDLPYFKKTRVCNNYRGITLLNATYKVYAKIITRRLNTINVHMLSEQCGFHNGAHVLIAYL